MTDLSAIERDQERFQLRLVAAAAFVLLCFALLVARLVWLQVVRYDDLSEQAESNRVGVVPLVPNRGIIMDRNGVVLAKNYTAYTLEVTPGRVRGELGAMVDALAELMEISPKDRRRFLRLVEESKSFEALPLRHRLTEQEVARFTANRYRFAGAEVRAKLYRTYPLGDVGSHVIGYVGRISARDRTLMEDWEDEDQSNYRGTDVLGKHGLEQSYERELHGQTGFEQFETSAGGRAVRRLGSQGATPGNSLVLTVDIKLQALVEKLFGKRRGALVAVDPRNGEVLAMVSAPGFDPNLFVEGIDVENWRALSESPDKPLLNRALRGLYPPGSTYKPFIALAALHTGFRTPQQGIQDRGFFEFYDHRFRDDVPGGHGWVDMYKSIVQSCDTYYYVLASEMGVERIAEQMSQFGFGEATGVDMVGESRGVLPTPAWKQRMFRKPAQKRWIAGDTISLGIGQGYNSYTMLQLAHATAILAAGGQRPKLHLARSLVDGVTGQERKLEPAGQSALSFQPEHLATIRRALVGVNREGTSKQAFYGAPYVAAGKTGTSQVVNIGKDKKYDASKLAERFRDHALYMAYAPADAPTVALAVIVENAGFGADAAAPIARRVLDYVLAGRWPSDVDLAATQRGGTTAPIGGTRRAVDVVLPGAEVAPSMASVAAMAASAAAAAAASAPPFVHVAPPAATARAAEANAGDGGPVAAPPMPAPGEATNPGATEKASP